MAALRTHLLTRLSKYSMRCRLPSNSTNIRRVSSSSHHNDSEQSSEIIVKPEENIQRSELENMIAMMPSIGHKAMYDMLKMAVNLKDLKPALPTQSTSLAPYVNNSETLQQLLKLGIDLSLFEKYPKVATHLALADFERDCKPYVLFYHSLGIQPGEIGVIISRFPEIFFESMENLEVRVNYFLSKKFLLTDIARIVTRKPMVIAMTTKEIDSQLGYLQKLYKLNGGELRTLVIKCPTLIAWKNRHLLSLNHQLSKDLLQLSESKRQKMLLEVPEISFNDPQIIQDRFDYLVNEMSLPVERIVEHPLCLSRSQQLLKMRHKFLVHIGRTQYDPELPNFIPLSLLMNGSDKEFCDALVTVPMEIYKAYLKTL